MALQSGLSVAINSALSAAAGIGVGSVPIASAYGFQWPDGTALGFADRLYQIKPTIAASGTLDVDLAGTLTDPFGAALTFARIRAFYLKANASNTNNVVIGNGTNPWLGWFGAAAHTEIVQPNGLSLHVAPTTAGWPVTAATADILHFANSGAGTGVTFELILIGASA
ncbi:MAG: hypothetical protein ACJ72N_06870 [Labedaea sp.]